MRAFISHLFSTALMCAVVFQGIAQDPSLARDFDKLSAKERAQIAREEQEAASKDLAYQAVMEDAERLFREKAYEGSMAKFQEARVLRPYNVYPKVKIQDLEVLIAKRDAAAAEKERAAMTDPPEPMIVPQPQAAVQPVRAVVPETNGRDPVKVVPVATEVVVPEPPVAEHRPLEEKPVTVRVMPVEQELELVEGEEVYKEGRSVVVERRILLDGRIVVFRKVTHPWGAIDHFRDGSPIPARTYNEVMTGR